MDRQNRLLSSYSLFEEICSDGFFRANDRAQIRAKCRRRLDQARDYDIIFLVIEEISSFCQQLPSLKSKIFLIVGRSDESFDSRFNFLLADSRILHIFAQNCDHSDHEKLTPLPLGFENPGWLYSGNPTNDPSLLLASAKESIGLEKNNVILSAFNINTNVTKRSLAMIGLSNALAPVLFYSYPNSHSEDTQRSFYRALAESLFVACPHGNGVDSHRIWQSLLMGCIPLTTRNKALEPFQGLGLVFLENWAELATLSISDLSKRCSRRTRVPLKELSTQFWAERILHKCLQLGR